MEIRRNEVAEPQWTDWDYAKASKHGVFSREGWKRTVEWKFLLEHARRTKGLCHLMFENTYPSCLFMANIELLETNLYVYGDLFYWLTGLNANTLDLELDEEALTRIYFWNMNCYKDLRQILSELEEIESLFIDCLKQAPLWNELKGNPIWKSDNWIPDFSSTLEAPISWTDGNRFARHHAYTYVQEIYKEPKVDETELTQRIVKILQLTTSFKILLGACGNGIIYDFNDLLSSFRKSEKARSRYIKPWERYFNGTRDSLIEKMRNNPDLAPWVDRYIYIEGNRNVIGRLFCEEYDNGLFYPLKKEREEDYYNTDNWLSILTIAAVLQEYDEQHANTTEPDKNNDEILLTKLSMFFKDEDIAKRFLAAARTMNDRQIIALVKHYKEYGNCTNTSKALWEVLHEAGVYTAGYSNWSAQI